MHSVLIALAFNVLLYLVVFLLAAFYAARNYRRRHDPEQQPFKDSQNIAVPPTEEAEDGWLHMGGYGGIADVGRELLGFAKRPVPFLMETANIDDDAVHHLAGLDARIYVHFTGAMMKLFAIVAVIALAIILPINLLSDKAHWMPQGDFARTTANGFYDPAHGLLIHSMCAIFISIIVVLVVFYLREHLVNNVRGPTSREAIPPVQAYTVEIQGMRVNPIVTPEEVRNLLDVRFSGKYMDVVVCEDMTDLVDLVEQHRELMKRLDRHRQELENEGTRPTIRIGMLRWVYMGEKVDAISHMESEIGMLEEQIGDARRKERVGTGSGFVTFNHRRDAAECCRLFDNARKANKKLGVPTIGVRGQLCRNPGVWGVCMAAKPQDIHWRNLRYSAFHHALFTGLGFVLILILLSFVVTPLFFLHIFLSLEEVTASGAEAVVQGGDPNQHGYQGYLTQSHSNERWLTKLALSLLTPASILLVNTVLMPYIVHWAVKHMGHRSLSHMQRTSFSFIFFFMIVNLLFIPALSLSSLDELLYISKVVPIDQLLAQVVLYGSAEVFFINYAAQAAFLSCAFYFVFHTTSPTLINWASGEKGEKLSWEFDFAYFYSSLLGVVAIALMFVVTVPLLLPFVAVFLLTRYYTDKWQLVTAHSRSRPDPAPETTASSVFVALILCTALAQAAFAAWLELQEAKILALFSWCACGFLFLIVAIPFLRRRLVTVPATWVDSDEEHKETMHVPAPQAYAGAYANPYMQDPPGVGRPADVEARPSTKYYRLG